mmetsp:Transcript_10502/g.23859  ORF Transcript_10502/g.23859 Transcript_10502/m.23859 type:complete len:214 (+) Transcript_10502:151-792(+)|eukprot:CAMPEP_0178418922 /NCGR_PEP_ID=MMETSP0689_2-20121128/25339_1 /TAXON_ID=160604 /ORGANISM="Amphidinium massartii, Strain CS-259" /LENGTH=213 /DNA_ID=CAMNT_0020040333 /DNA_START=95 /DNA_END=736 /DNA_ORIENTATION=-
MSSSDDMDSLDSDKCAVAKQPKDKKDKAEKKKAKKDKKKAKKDAKKAKKELKKVRKEMKKAEKVAKKAKKDKKLKGGSSDSSSSSVEDLPFLLDQNFGSSAGHVDRANAQGKIERALGLATSNFAFVSREDDAAIAKEVGHQPEYKEGVFREDQSKDWICQRIKGDGEACGARNFVRNEKCYVCNALRPAMGNKVLRSQDLKGVRADGHFYRG